jgi:antitoxin HicB
MKSHQSWIWQLPEWPALAFDAQRIQAPLDFYFDDQRAVPLPSKLQRGETLVSLPLSIAAKVLLLNEMLAQNIRPADLARRMNVLPQEVNRLLSLDHKTKIDTVALALLSLGRRFELSVA